MDFAAHLAAADNAALGILGGGVRYQPDGGAAVDVRGIFDAAYVLVAAGEAGVSSSGPAVFLLLKDLPADPEDDDPTITIDGVAYRAHTKQKDGQGGIRLLLHRREPEP
jgi:hypothetical protein